MCRDTFGEKRADGGAAVLVSKASRACFRVCRSCLANYKQPDVKWHSYSIGWCSSRISKSFQYNNSNDNKRRHHCACKFKKKSCVLCLVVLLLNNEQSSGSTMSNSISVARDKYDVQRTNWSKYLLTETKPAKLIDFLWID